MPRLQAALPAAANVGNSNTDTTCDQEPSVTSLSRDRAFLLSNVEIGGQIQTAVQQVHIISEDEAELGDEAAYDQKRIDLLSEMSGSGNSVCVDFAGFPSPGNTLLNVTPYGSKDSLRRGDVSAVDVGSNMKTAHKRSRNSHTEETPVKRHKEQHRRLAAREHLQTNIDQIFEIDSNSTSKSRKEKRLQLQKSLNRNSQQQQQTPNTNNRRSTETSSEFPVSSPSNPLAGRGNKYTKRPPLLKNTLPADAFERNLALITSRNPQMSLAEKMNAWQCDTELSDVEDVNNFDDLFKKYDEQKRKFMRSKNKNKEGQDTGTPTSSVNLVEESPDKYDFLQFRTRMRNLAHARKEANKLKEYDADKPTTSAAAVIHAGLRRPKANTVNTNASTYNSVSADSRKRAQQLKKVGKNSTTPPSTSSSERIVRGNDADDDEAAQHVNHCYPSPKKKPHLQKSPPSPEVLVFDKVHCASSSEETSQDASHAKPRYLRSNTAVGSRQLRPSATAMSPVQRGARISLSSTAVASNIPILPSLLVHCTANTDEESVFRRHGPNREIDKEALTFEGIAEEQQGLIQMRLDFLNEKKDLHLKERARELFKTPTVPQKYTLPTTTAAGENHQQQQQHELYHSPNKHNGHNDVNDFSSLLTANQLSESPTFVTEQLKVSAVDVGSSFHQQHEFCNYLGLTGMSTAHAVANAVAELAKCNMTRRSLRVQRLQQLEKRERTEKNHNNDDDERKGLEALKLKQLRELKRRMNLDKQVATSSSSIEATTVALQQQYYVSPPALDSQFSVASTSAAAAVKFKTEPEIKILCQISSANKEEAEVVSRNYAKQLVAPIRQTLLRHLKSKRAAAGNLSSNGNSTCPRSLHSDDEQLKAKRRAPSARKRLSQHGRRERDRHTPQTDIKSEPAPSCRSVQNPQCSESTNKLMKVREQQQLREDLCQESVENHARMQLLRDKFQKCLEASRQTKPSIFIVKSMASGVGVAITNPCNEPKRLQAGTTATELPTLQTYNSTIKAVKATASNLTSETLLVGHSTTTIVKSSKLSKRRKNFEQLATGAGGLQSLRSQGRLHKLITRSGSNMRQLRSRKIYIVKAKKRSKTCKVGQQSAEKVDKATLTCGANNSPKVEALLQNAALATSAPAKASIAPADAAMHELVLKTKINSAVNTDFVLPMPITHTAEIIAPNSMQFSLNANAGYQSPLQKMHKDMLQRLTEPTEIEAMDEAADAELSKALEPESELEHKLSTNNSSRPTQTPIENETVVVSSTTNTYDENMLRGSGSSNNNVSRNNISQLPLTLTKDIYKNCAFLVESQELLQHQHLHPLVTQDSATQCYAIAPPAPRRAGGTEAGGIHYLTAPARTLQNPLQRKNGQVLYIYYELDVLIVVQELLVSFWKYSKLMSVLTLTPSNQHSAANKQSQTSFGNSSGGETQAEGDVVDISGEWLGLGDCRRLVNDIEIATPYANRVCMHNSMPLYLEMRCRELTHERRDCNLLSMYINIYYYHDDDLHAKTHSIQLDTVQSLSSTVIYTAIPESRYFVMSWPQENILGRIRSGLCKYSLTPQLDTLASIREFKSMRHELLYLECTVDDKLLGFGATQLTIWDHRSGDVLMNYDLDLPLGRNLGSIYYPSMEIGQNNMILLFQYVQHNDEADGVLMLPEPPEMLVIACSISHTTPSHRVLQRQQLPQPAFDVIKSAINTGEHLLITAQSDDEIWISCTDPSIITCVAPQHTHRFYSRGRTQLIELTDSTLMVDSFANHVLKLAAATPTHEITLSTRASAESQPQDM